MKLTERLRARRQRKAHERYLEEREWQRRLNEQETQDAVQKAAENWGAGGQATSSGN